MNGLRECVKNEMTIDEKIADLNCVYVAKNLAQYLHVTVPEPPKEVQDALKKPLEEQIEARALKMYNEMSESERVSLEQIKDSLRSRLTEMYEEEGITLQEYDLQEKEHNEKLAKLGILTQQERDAYPFANYMGLVLTLIISRGLKNDPVEVIDEKNGIIQEIRITKELFENYIQRIVNAGIREDLISKYWISIEGIEIPQIVNLDFVEKAVEWLTQEVYSKISQGNECEFLERVVIKQEDEKINLKLLPPKYINTDLPESLN